MNPENIKLNMNSVRGKTEVFLLTHPLYSFIKDHKLTVYVYGDSEYSHVFMDLILSVCQSDNFILDIKADMNKNDYLKERTALGNFVSIDGITKDASYAAISFVTEENPADFSFYASADSSINERLSKGKKNSAYVSDGEIHFDSLECDTDLNKLAYMAFNTHFLWNSSKNKNIKSLIKEFNQDYNQSSSLAFVLSIPYKMYGITDDLDYSSISEYLLNRRKEKDYKKLLASLAALEHKRWIIEKLTSGMIPYHAEEEKKYDLCVASSSIKINKTMHPCIVKSTDAFPLLTYSKEQWDSLPVSKSLDDLDRMSIELHRRMHDATKEEQRIGNLNVLYESLKSLIPENQEAKDSFIRFTLVFQGTLALNKSQAENFELRLNQFRAKVPACIDVLDSINKEIFPFREASMYRDYKKYDMDFIENIPFIISHSPLPRIGMVLSKTNLRYEDSGRIFHDVASATGLYASHVSYIYKMESEEEMKYISARLKGIKKYFETRENNLSLSIALFRKNGESVKDLKKALDLLKEKNIIAGGKAYQYSDTEDLEDMVINYLTEEKITYFDGTVPFLDSQMDAMNLTSELIKNFRYIEYLPETKEIRTEKETAYLGNYPDLSYFTIQDMFALANATPKYQYPESKMEEIESLEGIYFGEEYGEEDFSVASVVWNLASRIISYGGADNTHIHGTWNAILGNRSLREREMENAKKLLSKLEEKGYLSNLSTDSVINFDILNPSIKELFLKSGDYLERYVYFSALKTGYFDDILTGTPFTWEDEKVINELDCFLTKGYKSILVECKCVESPQEQYYLTLDSLADHFGIFTKKVLVITSPVNDTDNYGKRSHQMDIITISSKEDIKNIGNRLVSIMKGEL